VNALLKAGFNVSAIARSTSTSTFPDAVRVIKGEYSPSFLESAFKGIDAVVLAVGAGGLAEQKTLIDAAAKAGVKRLIPSEFGGDTANPVAVAAVPFYQSKADIITYLKTITPTHPNLSWTAIITGPFFDWVSPPPFLTSSFDHSLTPHHPQHHTEPPSPQCLKLGFLGFNHSTHHATLYDQGRGKFSATTLLTVGAAVAAVLSHPEQYGNEYLYISSFTTSQAEILAALKKASGGAEWTVEEKSAAAYIEGGREKAARGEIMGTYDLIFGTTFHGGYGGDFASIRKISNRELGLEEETLEKVTKEVYEAATAKH